MAVWHVLGAIRPTRGFKNAADFSQERFTVELDAMVSETPEFGATVTKNVVERGAEVNDHVSLSPLILTMEGVISDTPTSLVKTLTGGALADFKKAEDRPAQKAYGVLKKMWETAEPITFVGRLEVYKNMVITSLSAPVRAQTGGALMFTCRMQKVNIVESKTITLEKLNQNDKSTRAKAAPVANMGYQPAGTFQGVEPTAKVTQAVADTPIGKFAAAGGQYPVAKPIGIIGNTAGFRVP